MLCIMNKTKNIKAGELVKVYGKNSFVEVAEDQMVKEGGSVKIKKSRGSVKTYKVLIIYTDGEIVVTNSVNK